MLVAAILASPLAQRTALAETPPAAGCGVPPDLVARTQPLPHVAAALRPGGRLDVLALGSGTLLGPRSGVEGSVPDHMVEALRAAAPGVAVHLVLHAARAETATEMLAAMRRELAAHSYQLVLWQTGTVEAVKQLPAAQFRATLGEGAAFAAETGADLVLIDVPYSRLLEDHSDLQPYRDAMQDVALHSAAVLFRRFDLMHRWAETGALDIEAVSRKDREKTANRLRACLGEALARLIMAARGP